MYVVEDRAFYVFSFSVQAAYGLFWNVYTDKSFFFFFLCLGLEVLYEIPVFKGFFPFDTFRIPFKLTLKRRFLTSRV